MFVLDGRNRLEALTRLGCTFIHPAGDIIFPDGSVTKQFTYKDASATDPAAYVISANIRRRHLSKEQQAELIVRTIEAGKPNDRATVARSFSPMAHKKGGSTKDPVLAKAIAEAEKHGISKRTVQNARAKIQGKTPAPRKPVGSDVSTETIDEVLTELRRRGDQFVAEYIALLLRPPGLTQAEVQAVSARFVGWRKRFEAIAHQSRRRLPDGIDRPLPKVSAAAGLEAS